MKFDEVLDLLVQDRDTVVRRFGGSLAQIERFVRKFPSDKSFGQLSEAMQTRNYPAIEAAAHTLKGVAGNLGFDALFVNSEEMVAAVRREQYDKLAPLFELIESDYQKVIETISLID